MSVLTTDLKLKFQPPVIGHRGACGYAPENTMTSFTKAVQMGVKWIEFDCMLTATGEVIIIHDEKLKRTTNGTGRVQDYPLGQLLSLDAGAWFSPIYSGEKIPTFLQLLDFLKDTDISANVELKPQIGLEEKLVDRVIMEINRSGFFAMDSKKLLFSSFSFTTLDYLRKRSPHAQIGLLLHQWEPDWQSIEKNLHCVSIHVNQEILERDQCSLIKDKNKSLLSYTVNDPKRALELFSWGVDAVFSDYPDVIIHCAAGV